MMTSPCYKKVGNDQVISIIINDVIGQGLTSKVFSGTFDEKDVAVKRVDKDDRMSKELELLRDFQHENIVRYLYKDVDDEFMYIVMEKCDCTLQQFIGDVSFQRKEYISPLEILRQTTNGLAYLHDKNIIHRDLKPSNTLMLLRDCKWVVRIADFGISKQLPRNRREITQTSIKGTVGNAAPEILNNGKISKKSDIFSLGILLYFTLSGGEHPYGTDMLKLEAGIRDGEQPTMEFLDADDAKSLILPMIAHKCEDRFDVIQVQSHHLFWNNEKKLNFIQAVSDYAISKNTPEVISTKLIENSTLVIGNSWRATVYAKSPVIEKELEEMRPKKQGDDIMSLLRNIRNLKNHFHEKSTELKKLMANSGSVDDMLEFFTNIFPALISHVYEVMRSEEQENPIFKCFFHAREESIPVMQSPARQISSKQESEEPTIECVQQSDGKRAKVELVLRNYQWELAEQALGGHNSLVVAPTGSGKTAVLTEIIRQHILKPEHSDRHVVFMAPKTALALQQFHFLKRHLSCAMDYIIGDNVDSAPAGRKILDNKITVLTPQILINELKRGKEESYLGFKDISLLIFDECHHATKKHPYKKIMDMFLDAQNEKKSEQLSIQIVGVTASPGVGKAKCREKVKENLLELLANLNIVSVPAVVEKNVVGLNQHQNKIKEYYIEVETEEIFGNEVKKVMNELEDCVKKINAQNGAEDLNKIPSDKSKQSYEKWTDDLLLYGRKDLSDQDIGRRLITYAKHLRMYYYLLQLKDLVPNAMKHTNKQVKFKQVGFENIELDKKNKVLQKKALTINVPMLDQLFEVVKEEFTNNKDARCIIFVKTRLTAMSLQECMEENEDLSELQPLYMTGKHASDTSEATTKVGQENVLKSFRSGESKILIATSVAEEGLDIRECNLVIMYNHVTGEVGRVQRAGRGRAVGSRAIVITSVNSDHVSREVDNKICALASKIAMEDLKSIPQADLKNDILMIQQQQIAKRRRRENEEALDDENKDPSSKWEILCVDCGNFITTGDKLRHIENVHSVIKDEGFCSRVLKVDVELQKSPSIRGTANFLCNNPKCGNKIALEMVYGTRRYPTLAMKRIKLRNDDGIILVPKKKKNLPFSVNISIDHPVDEVEVEPTETYTESASDNTLENSQILELFGLIQIED